MNKELWAHADKLLSAHHDSEKEEWPIIHWLMLDKEKPADQNISQEDWDKTIRFQAMNRAQEDFRLPHDYWLCVAYSKGATNA